MQSRQNYTVIGVFENEADADRAVAELYRDGFRDDQIGVARKHVEAVVGETIEGGTEAGPGAVTGAVAGLGLGALAGLGVLSGVIPVIGPAIAGGTLGVILSNAAAGAGIAGLIGALVGAGVPEHEARYYHDEFAAGRTIVTVNTMDKSNEAKEILRRNRAYDMSSRATPVDEPKRVDVAVHRDDVGGKSEKASTRLDTDDFEDDFS
ncbi:general stress protein [Paludisphaera borealis]|uniref:General stress protein 17M-like domain-containing protein n=1 Tax=Paludisphaera borealis TaxID=1387353 RepID=A0A1U7CWP3_9BACT|nr:general stress protein [Paludisphaera borealis]APW63367.1 hypothetical protein BSF38_04932 [Paludisphaera borealis]